MRSLQRKFQGVLAKKLFENIGYLAVAQIGTYLLPLITIPYISRTVGVENYGLVEFATVAMLYFISIVEYSFNTSATRKIAAFKDNFAKVSFVYSSVMFARLMLFAASTVVFSICLFTIPEFAKHWKLMILAYPVVLGWAIYPLFLFQGLQQLKVVALGNLALKVLATALIFLAIQGEADFVWVAAINGGSQLLIALGILFYIPKKFKNVRFFFPGWRAIKVSIYEGRFLFTSDFFTKIYALGSVFIAAFFVTPAHLGLFAAGMKLITVGSNFIFTPLTGALFPHLNAAFKVSKQNFYAQLKKALLILIGITAAAAAVLIVFSDLIIKLLFGAGYESAAPLMQIMAPILILSSFTHIFLYQGVLTFKKDKIYLLIIVVGGLATLGFSLLIIPKYGVTGAAFIKLMGEFLIAAMAIFAFYTIKKRQTK